MESRSNGNKGRKKEEKIIKRKKGEKVIMERKKK